MIFFTSISAIAVLTLTLTSHLVLANKKLHVEEDPRIDIVEEMLPHTNCGACGFPGCRPFAEALVLGQVLPGDDPDALAVRSAPGSCCFCTRPTCDRPQTTCDDSHRENEP